MKNTRLASGLCLALAILCTSCIGPFNAFNGMVHWNQKATDNKFGNEAIFLGLFIIPVYEVMFLGDLIIFNSIEFWSGSNPIAPSASSPAPASK
jgi:hypothetical protein